MNKIELHDFVEKSNGNEKNICQIYALKDGKPVYEDRWHGFAISDAVHVMSVTKSVMALLAGTAQKKITVGVTGTLKPKIFDRVQFVEKYVIPIIEGE